ncbi:MAG: ABC transporter permease subunit [Rhodospirillales bacterium]|nr:ABC transporter permease subunit [Rhodospirillales bacterium]
MRSRLHHRLIAVGKRLGITGRGLAIAVPYAWLAAFFLVPFAIVLKLSFSEVVIAIPPYLPLFEWGEDGSFTVNARLDNYITLFTDDLYWRSYLGSLKIAAISTAVALLIGYPIAYGMSRAPAAWRPVLVVLVILPFWTSFLIRVYALIGILKKEGLLNLALTSLGLIREPLTILNTDIAIYIGIVYSYLPFVVLPIYASLERFDLTLLEAAADLGCRPTRAFWTITLPLSLPGVAAAALLIFIPAVGEFVIPDLLGGSETLMIGKTLWSEFFNNRDWPVASAVAIALLVLLVAPIVYFQRLQAKVAHGERW